MVCQAPKKKRAATEGAVKRIRSISERNILNELVGSV